MRKVQIESRDALNLINFANDASFIYADPPYIGATQKHYAGYTEENYEALLKALEVTPAKFMLSSYSTPILTRYVEKNKWISKEIEMAKSGTGKKGTRKVEVLTMNYLPTQINLF